jgi:hypothetical protein
MEASDLKQAQEIPGHFQSLSLGVGVCSLWPPGYHELLPECVRPEFYWLVAHTDASVKQDLLHERTPPPPRGITATPIYYVPPYGTDIVEARHWATLREAEIQSFFSRRICSLELVWREIRGMQRPLQNVACSSLHCSVVAPDAGPIPQNIIIIVSVSFAHNTYFTFYSYVRLLCFFLTHLTTCC